MENRDTFLKDLAKKLSALDNEIKLKILTRLIQEGTKSITDISKELKLTFSTTHKYLEQLEAAGLVTSKQVTENRLKRLFYIKDFEINLSPKDLADIGKQTKKETAQFNLINEVGKTVNFDEKTFSKKYTERGLPYSATEAAIESIKEQAYDGITLLELRNLFSDALHKQMQNVRDVYAKINAVELHKRTFENLLRLVHPEALDQHKNGDIFIKNLGKPILLNCSHDLRGIAVHGVNGNKPKDLEDFFSQIIEAVKFTNNFSRPIHAVDSINYMSAPYPKQNLHLISKFLEKLNNLNQKIFLGIDIGLPPHLTTIPLKHLFEKEKGQHYSNYSEQAELIGREIIKNLKTNKYPNIRPIIKFWGSKITPELLLENAYLAKMGNSKPSTFLGELGRFDDSWKEWMGNFRVGEAQEIVLNTPRLALKSGSKKAFKDNLISLIDEALEYTYNMVELFTGEYIRKHNTQLPSPITKKWSYLELNDCKYSISLTGFPEAIKIITGHNLENNLEFAREILKACNKYIKEKTTAPIRITLKENLTPSIAKRFYTLDSKIYELNMSAYTQGICSSLETTELQKYLPGGACFKLTNPNLQKLNEKNFTLVKNVAA